ncbi:MAG TPA: methyltransferase, partial [Xanthomonadaceae bacterium]|nr:methyltransferase [Xanthomonadaceae bacterium]
MTYRNVARACLMVLTTALAAPAALAAKPADAAT